MSNTSFLAVEGIAAAPGSRTIVAVGNTGQRPSAPQAGDFRFNTDLGIFEGYFAGNTSWNQVGNTLVPANGTFVTIAVGNTTSNAVINSSGISFGTVTINSTSVNVGGAVHTATSLTLGNSSINTTALGIGNSTVSAVINSTSLIIGGATLTGSNLTIGNSTVNATINSTSFTGTALSANNSAYLGGIAAAQYAYANQLASAAVPGGSNTYVQFNNSGVFQGTAGFTFNFNSNTASVSNAISVGGTLLTSTSWGGSANSASYIGSTAAANVWTQSTLTNLSQLTNGPGYITTLSSGTNYAVNIITATTYLYSDGNIYAQGDVYAGYSDRRLKDLEWRVECALDKVSCLSAWYYTRNDVAPDMFVDVGKKRRVGLLAQEVQVVLPEAVSLVMKPDGQETDYLTVDYTRVVPLLVAAINELRAEVNTLKMNTTRFS